ncbi:MAG: protein TolQ [Alphaproteobacteria bacterium]|nr:protein TolQ [Alphaproteobacteria bacterium]
MANDIAAVGAIPTPKVDGIELAGSHAGGLDLSPLGMFMEADFIVKSVIIILLLASFWSWAIIFEKIFAFKVLQIKTKKFEKSFWSGDLLEDIYDRIKQKADHPMAMIFVAGMYEWKLPTPAQRQRMELKVGIKERIFQSMNLARNQALDKLERNLGFLATVGSTAPFVGLFGTVWGIMNSFQSIALMKNTSLAVVAPGIAEALFATAIGLFAAIPAVIFYNKFSNDMARFSSRLDEFSGEFGAILSRELDK